MDKENRIRGISRRRFLKDVVLGGAAVGASLTMVPGLRPAHAAKKGVYTMKYDCYIGPTAEPAQLDNWFLDEIVKPDQLGEDPLVVFAWPDTLLPDDSLHPYAIYGEAPDSKLVKIKAESWFFWIEEERRILVTMETDQSVFVSTDFLNPQNSILIS